MLQLIEFLLNNIVVLFILFGIVSFVLQKLRGLPGGQQQRPQGPAGMPTFGGGTGERRRPAFPDLFELEDEPEKTRERERPAVTVADEAEGFVLRPIEEAQAPAVKLTPEPARSAAKPRVMEPELTAEKAAQGMIWAEVFGPPRALRPYSARIRGRRDGE